jgi:hypothetical protein
LEDPHAGVRRGALQALMKRGSREDAILLSRDLDGLAPILDPQEPVPADHATRAATTLGLTLEETRARYEALAAQYRLKLAWRPGNP